MVSRWHDPPVSYPSNQTLFRYLRMSSVGLAPFLAADWPQLAVCAVCGAAVISGKDDVSNGRKSPWSCRVCGRKK